MNLFSGIALSIGVLCTILSLGIFRLAKEKTHYLWAFFNLFVAAWAFWSFQAGKSISSQEAILNWKLSFTAATFISILYYHLVCAFCQIKKPKILSFFYIQGILFTPLILHSNYFVASTNYIFNSIYYHEATPLFTLWLILWTVISLFSFCNLYKCIRNTDNKFKKMQASFLFWGMMVGFVGGVSTAIPAYGINFYPVWQASICLYVIILTFAIIRHNFLKARIVLRSLIIPALICGIFIIILTYIFLDLNLFALTSLSLGIACLMLAFLVFAYSKHSLHRIWSLFNLAVFSWAMGTFFAGISKSPEHAEMAWRWAYGLGPFVPSVFYHFVYLFCELKKKNNLRVIYLLGVLFIPINFFAPSFIKEINYLFGSIYYHKATPLFTIFMVYLAAVVFLSFKELIHYLKVAKGSKRTQVLYILYGFGIGWGGGITTFLPAYGVPIYPAWNFTICIYTMIMTYAIFKYQIMDIKIVGARLGIFILVYSLVLGMPFGLAVFGKQWLITKMGENWYLMPMLAMLFLGTTGPFIYLFFQRKAEDKLQEEEYAILNLLKKASSGLSLIRDIHQLLKLIVNILGKSLQLSYIGVYLLDTNTSSYILKASEPNHPKASPIKYDDLLIQELKRGQPLIHEKILFQIKSSDEVKAREILSKMNELSAHIILPAIADSALLGFIILGEQKKKIMQSQDLIDVLSVIGSQAGRTIADCRYWEKENLEERRKSLDHVTSSMGHELDNPIAVIQSHVEHLKKYFKDPELTIPEVLRKKVDKSMGYILEATGRVSGMITAIQEYSKKTSGDLIPIKLYEVEDGYWKLMGHAFRKESVVGVEYTKDIAENMPYLLGDKIQLEEVLMNFGGNALHSVLKSGVEIKRVHLKIFQKDDDWLRIECSDTGYGIEKHLIDDIFLAHVTTKGSMEGTGLGLFRVRKIVELHKGKVWAESEGKGKGAKMIVELPIFKGNIKEYEDKTKSSDGPKKLF